MEEFKWYDIEQVQPKKGQAIFYLDSKTIDAYRRYFKEGSIVPCFDDIDRGLYIRNNLVEWHYDMAPEEFRLWFPIPSVQLDNQQ